MVELSSNLSAIYTKLCARTFPLIFGLYAIFSAISRKLLRHLHMKMRTPQCIWKDSHFRKKVKTESKSTHKPRHNTCSNYVPLEWRACRPLSVTESKTNIQPPYFRIYNQRTSYDLPQTLQGDQSSSRSLKRCQSLMIQHIVFPQGARKYLA